MALNQIAFLLLLFLPLFSHFYSPFATVFQLASESTSHCAKETSIESKRVARSIRFTAGHGQ